MKKPNNPANGFENNSTENGVLIHMQDVVKTFQSAAGKITVLKGITTEIYPGEFVSIVGRSGSGKSTLLNMLTGIDHPTSGTVNIGGTLLHTLNESQLASWRGRNMGIVFQFFQLLPMLTLVENVMLPMDFCNTYAPAERENRAMQILARVNLHGFEHKLPGAISGGQQQSAAVARALATDPPILVADEPTGNLDSNTAEQIIQLFQELVGQGKTVVMVTHDSVLAKKTQRSLILSDGEIIHPAIASAFPNLAHELLLKLNHLAQPVTFPSGAEINPEKNLLVVVAGQLETLSHQAQPEQASAIFGPGKLVDLSDLRRSGQVIRAGNEQPVDVFSLDDGTVRELLESPLKGRES